MTDQCCATCGYFFNETAPCKCHRRTPMTDIGRDKGLKEASALVTDKEPQNDNT